MDFEKDDLRTMLDDLRARHGATVALLYFNDTQAMSLLRLFVTVGIATASGAAAGLSSAALVPRPMGYALAAATIIATAGSGFSLRAMTSAIINLPGRDPDFWQWARLPEVDRKDVAEAYLSNLAVKANLNNEVNLRSGAALDYAKRCALAAPIVALLAGIAALIFKL